MIKLFDGKYEIYADVHQFILREFIPYTNKKGEPSIKHKDRYHPTLDGIIYRVIELESKLVFNAQEWDSLEALANAMVSMEARIMKEIKKVIV